MGAFEIVPVWVAINNRTMTIKDLALGANNREFAFNVSDIKFGARNNFAVRIVEARGHMRAALLRKC